MVWEGKPVLAMRRREFMTLLAAWPIAARAQQGERVRRVGLLVNTSENEAIGQKYLEAFRQGLRESSWVEGRNVRIDVRWGGGDAERYRTYAAELVGLEPDVIVAATTPAVVAVQQASRAMPIVFGGVIDPIGSGLIRNMARPGGNATGFTDFEYAIAAKWLELLKEIAPRVTRVAVLRNVGVAAGIGQFAAIQALASATLQLNAIGVRNADEVERGIADFSREPNGGLIVAASGFAANHSRLISTLAARHSLPAVYPFRYFAEAGGLISYGPDESNQYRQAASYVDRILKGEKPSDLPVQAPTKYELVINLKTAKALGLEVPPTLLARADEVIE